MKKTPGQLRIEAKKLMDIAERIEQAEAIRIGKIVLKAAETDFKGFDIEDLKAAINNTQK